MIHQERLDGTTLTLEITELGGMGDGVAIHADRPVYVPYTMPGDTVVARVRLSSAKAVKAELVSIVSESPERMVPPCVHFTICGGCDLQHLPADRYYAFKEAALREAVARAGLDDARVEKTVRIPPATRRRADLKVRFVNGCIQAGFYTRRSHELVDLKMCPVLDRRIEELALKFRDLIVNLREPESVSGLRLTQADSGIDAVLSSAPPVDKRDYPLMAAFADRQDLARISWTAAGETETITERQPVQLHFGPVAVDLPPDGFLQATKTGQEAITAIMLEATGDSASVADLYAGCGAYTFALANVGRRVCCFEGNGDMVSAVQVAVERHGLNAAISVEKRDLFRRPVSSRELSSFDAAVINPPRNGAEPQVAAVAASSVPLVVMVSCNPRTFERDSKHLAANGYTLARAVPIDQFLWSTHLEAVAVFTR